MTDKRITPEIDGPVPDKQLTDVDCPLGEMHGCLSTFESATGERCCDFCGRPVINAAPCSLGVGCDEAGVCYAAAHDAPEQCPLNTAPAGDDVRQALRKAHEAMRWVYRNGLTERPAWVTTAFSDAFLTDPALKATTHTEEKGS